MPVSLAQGGCVVLVCSDTLVCWDCIGNANVSGKVVVMQGGKVMEEVIDCCCRGTRCNGEGLGWEDCCCCEPWNMAVYGLSCLQSGDSLNGLGLCSSREGRAVVCGWVLRGLWLQFGYWDSR